MPTLVCGGPQVPQGLRCGWGSSGPPGNVGSAGAGGAGWREASLQVRADVLFRCAQLEHTLQGDLLKSEQLYLQALAQVEGEDPAEAEGGGRGGRDLDADIVAGYARLLADDGVMQLGRAEVLLRRVLIQEPSHPQALLAYAALLLDSGGSLSQAETMIEQVLLDNASDPQGIAAYGTFAACVMGDYGIAEGLYRSALALDPGDVATHSQKSSI
jgi:tetratricopeptide (TPR) repeat protein